MKLKIKWFLIRLGARCGVKRCKSLLFGNYMAGLQCFLNWNAFTRTEEYADYFGALDIVVDYYSRMAVKD